MGWLQWIGWLLGLAVIAGAISFWRSDRQARYAAIFAVPQRKTIQRSQALRATKPLRWLMDALWPFEGKEDHASGQIDLDNLDPASLRQSGLAKGEALAWGVKRCADVGLSLALLVFTSPLLIGATIAILIDGGGPIFYRQTRVGLGGKTFEVLKFRTMVANAEKGGAQWAQRDDPRITRVGKFLRASRIDEIPQILPILQGHMSFIGPRPERPEFCESLGEQIPHYEERHIVKPGLTGWAQVNYPYGASVEDAQQKLVYDLYYIKHHSTLLDMFIVMKTLRVALSGDGSR